MIRRIFLIGPALFLLIFTGGIRFAQAVDFYYEIANPYAPNAEEYLISQTNVTKISENYGGGQFVTYYAPSVQTGQGVMLYKFDFAAASSQISLKFRLSAFNFGSSFGDITLSGSKTGSDFSTIGSLPKPVNIDSFLVYDQAIGSEFTGSDILYLRVEMNVTSWNIMSQWLRHDTTDPSHTPIFTISVNYVPEPSGAAFGLVAVGVVGITAKLRKRQNVGRA
jgi:hypothetical protein